MRTVVIVAFAVVVAVSAPFVARTFAHLTAAKSCDFFSGLFSSHSPLQPLPLSLFFSPHLSLAQSQLWLSVFHFELCEFWSFSVQQLGQQCILLILMSSDEFSRSLAKLLLMKGRGERWKGKVEGNARLWLLLWRRKVLDGK